MGKVKSLRDCLLESTVVNFDRIFFGNGRAKEVMKHICLPPGLFEDIQDKSHEMCWIIPHKSLIACLSSREFLNWVNIDIRRRALTPDDVLQIAKSNFPIKRLSFLVQRLTDPMFKVIEKFSSTIEVLEIGYDFEKYVLHKHLDQASIKFTKLKVLSIDLSAVPLQLLQRFDLSSCSESLKKLCIFEFDYSLYKNEEELHLIMKFTDSLKVLKNLESLTIEDEDICKKLNSIDHLKNLRTLDLRSVPPGLSLVKVLPKLENLTLPVDELICELRSLRSLNGKKLNYAGTGYGSVVVSERFNQLAKNRGSVGYFQSYLKSMDYSSCFHRYLTKTLYFMELLSTASLKNKDMSVLFAGCEIRKIEKGILDHIMWGLFHVIYCVDAITGFKDIWSHDFVIKMTNLLTSLQICEDKRFKEKLEDMERHFVKLFKHQPLIDYKKGYIALNPNSSISQLYKMTRPVV